MGVMTTYSMINVAATLDGRPVVGAFDGEKIMVEEGADVGTLLIGADGCGIFSQSADRSARITIKLKHTSPTHRQLLEKEKRQRAGGLTPFAFDVIEKASGEGGTADQCLISKAPGPMFGKEASVREWIIVTSDWEPNVTTVSD